MNLKEVLHDNKTAIRRCDNISFIDNGYGSEATGIKLVYVAWEENKLCFSIRRGNAPYRIELSAESNVRTVDIINLFIDGFYDDILDVLNITTSGLCVELYDKEYHFLGELSNVVVVKETHRDEYNGDYWYLNLIISIEDNKPYVLSCINLDSVIDIIETMWSKM
jgi:hypothetical protein